VIPRRRAIGMLAAGIGAASTIQVGRTALAFTRRCFDRRATCLEGSRSEALALFPVPQVWRRIEAGMSEGEVRAILGPPVEAEESVRDVGEDEARLYRWAYGKLPIDSSSVPGEFRFDVYFHEGHVHSTEQPFDARDPTLLKYPAPSVPHITAPQDRQVFGHYPRIVDFRWQPSLGAYPMSYRLELSIGQPPYASVGRASNALGRYVVEGVFHVGIPYLCMQLPGKQSYQWRVQAMNEYGRSEWTTPAMLIFEY
jgi:hypothetical protein